MQYRTLGRTGLRVSILSQGGAALGQQYGSVSQAQAEECVRLAVDAGVNLIDTSAYYGKGLAETMLGRMLPAIGRDRVYLCTKAGRFDTHQFDFTPAAIERSLDESLDRLGTDHVDILLAHDIEFADDIEAVFEETAACLHRLKRHGKCRFIGMSAYPPRLLVRAIERCELDVVISYGHYTLQSQRLLEELLPVAERHGVGILNGSPLCLGALSDHGPPAWHPADAEFKAVCARAVAYCRAKGADPNLLGMHFALAEERIASTITGTARASELAVNLLALSTSPDQALLQEVRDILAPIRNRDWPSGKHHQ